MDKILSFSLVFCVGALAFAQQYAGCPEEKEKEIWCNEAVVYCGQCPLANCGGLTGCNGAVLYKDKFDCEGNPGQQTKCVQVMGTQTVINPDGTVVQIPAPKTAVCWKSFKCSQRLISIDGQPSKMMCLADLGTPNNNLPPVFKPIYETKPCN